ncbi:hypothetical protein ANACOL_01812 [Anaerotruncus colihominis DSM 17241]|uniref:Uncharacterized protein n=1 Tax=Anaerotruncus colihominis DSM 17241 TaxID=445972 RepID=B0PAL1_9FIRM|nr:hypothetical protein ANACOL_01812 [Anaerotruncus colihominis DSM 17241]
MWLSLLITLIDLSISPPAGAAFLCCPIGRRLMGLFDKGAFDTIFSGFRNSHESHKICLILRR